MGCFCEKWRVPPRPWTSGARQVLSLSRQGCPADCEYGTLPRPGRQGSRKDCPCDGRDVREAGNASPCRFPDAPDGVGSRRLPRHEHGLAGRIAPSYGARKFPRTGNVGAIGTEIRMTHERRPESGTSCQRIVLLSSYICVTTMISRPRLPTRARMVSNQPRGSIAEDETMSTDFRERILRAPAVTRWRD